MIASLLLMVAIPQDAPPAVGDEIVVIGERMKAWRAGIRFRNGKATCTIRTSTGDAEIDRVGCDSMTQCFEAMKPRFDATQDKALSRVDRKQRLDEANQDLTTCVKDKRGDMIAELAARRAGPKE